METNININENKLRIARIKFNDTNYIDIVIPNDVANEDVKTYGLWVLTEMFGISINDVKSMESVYDYS